MNYGVLVMKDKKEIMTITLNKFEEDFYCECGNCAFDSGFFSCNEKGEIIEPTEEAGWEDLYVCYKCGQVYKVVTEGK